MIDALEKKTTLSRRELLRFGGFAALGATISTGALPINGFNLLSNSSPILIDPLTVATLASTGLSLVQSFSKSGGGLGAMLTYQIAMLEEISNQLNAIQRSLVDIETAVRALPEQVRSILRIQFQEELLAGISGAAERFRTEILIPSRSDASIFSNPPTISKMKQIYDLVSQNRATLSNYPHINSPQGAMIAPLTLSLEVVCASKLGETNEEIKGKLRSYEAWLERMLSDDPGSIASVQNQSVLDHDNIIDSLKDNPLAQSLMIGEYKLAAPQPASSAAKQCVVFSNWTIAPKDLDANGGTTEALQLLDIVGRYSVKVNNSISLKPEPRVGAMLLNFESSNNGIGRNLPGEHTVAGDPPKKGDYCTHHKLHSSLTPDGLSEAQVMQLAYQTPQFRNYEVYKTQLAAKVAMINEARANIAFCVTATTVATEVKNRIREYWTFLG